MRMVSDTELLTNSPHDISTYLLICTHLLFFLSCVVGSVQLAITAMPGVYWRSTVTIGGPVNTIPVKCLLKHHRLPLLDDDFLPSHSLSKDAYKDILMLALKKEEKPLQDILEEAKLLENVTNYTSAHPVTVDSFTTTVTRIKQTVSQGVAIRIIFTLARLVVKRVEVHRMEQGPRTATQGPSIPWMALRCVVDELDCCCRTLLYCLETYLPNIKQGVTHNLILSQSVQP